ncbi:MAG: NAD(P)/FAD-dependent oxidoreductase [Canibacter sp.]
MTLSQKQVTTPPFDVVIIGAGPGGLSAGLQLVRSRLRVLIVDSNRPRHSVTLQAHGFLTRDGISPLELRRLGREEFESYSTASFKQLNVLGLEQLDTQDANDLGFRDGLGFRVSGETLRGKRAEQYVARRVVLAVGLKELLPELPTIRAYYGTALHSCIACDAFEKRDTPIALIGETSDLFERAVTLRRFSEDLIVFTHGSDAITPEQESFLNARDVRVERRRISDILGVRAEMTGVLLEDGEVIPRVGGFVRPKWYAPLSFLRDLAIEVDDWGLVHVGHDAQTATRGLYAAGDIVPPGPEQLIIAAGDGARTAASIVRDLDFQPFDA